MKKIILAILITAGLLSSNAFAAETRALDVEASVDGATTFDVKLFRSTSSTTYDWATDLFPTMNFGTLVLADPANPATSPLAAAQHFMALVSVTSNTGSQYYVRYTGASLLHTDGVTLLSRDCFTVTGGPHYNGDGSTATVYTTGLIQTRHSAAETGGYNIYTSTATGTSDVFRVYFGITGDPTKTVSGTSSGLIPQSQRSGTYSANVVLTLTP